MAKPPRGRFRARRSWLDDVVTPAFALRLRRALTATHRASAAVLILAFLCALLLTDLP